MEFVSLVNWVFSVLLRLKANWDTGFWKTIQPNKKMDLSPFSIPKIEATKTTHGRACALSKICRILFSSFYPLFSSVFFSAFVFLFLLEKSWRKHYRTWEQDKHQGSKQTSHCCQIFTVQLARPIPRGTQVSQAEGFQLFKKAWGRSGKVSSGTKELSF